MIVHISQDGYVGWRWDVAIIGGLAPLSVFLAGSGLGSVLRGKKKLVDGSNWIWIWIWRD